MHTEAQAHKPKASNPHNLSFTRSTSPEVECIQHKKGVSRHLKTQFKKKGCQALFYAFS